ncbi:MAG TPA: nuclear transport factor 2 family protein [Thermoanaerobaculia bacterium]|nr:nuclear transport factor 2 family protein [Thermoanaerobaculia bacterium]
MIGTLVARKALAGAFDALNRHDLAKFMSAWRDEGVFVYPGEIPESGTFQGKNAVEGWFRHFFEQFPGIGFEIQDLCVRNIFDLAGTNVVAVHWNIQLTNREGRVGRNSGVTVVNIKRGKVFLVKDFIFDLGDNFRRNWSAP